MPRYRNVKWNDFLVRVFAREFDFIRVLPIVPYYWDSDIKLDLVVDRYKNTNNFTPMSLEYKWELRDIDNNIVRQGHDTYDKSYFNTFKAGKRKPSAIKIGYLKPYQYYRLFIILTDIYGKTSEPMQIASFSIKDRDEVFTQILIALIVIIMGIIIGLLAK